MSEPKDVYVVTDGEYSDYRILDVFDDRALAERYCDAHGIDASHHIDTYTLNAVPDEVRQGLSSLLVRWDGEKFLAEKTTLSASDDEPYLPCQTRRDGVARDYGWTTCWARDEEHAIKIATERRAMHLARESGMA